MDRRTHEVRRQDGVVEEHYWSPLNSTVLDACGDVAWIFHVVEDVTDIVRLQHETAQAPPSREHRRIIDKLRTANEALADGAARGEGTFPLNLRRDQRGHLIPRCGDRTVLRGGRSGRGDVRLAGS